MSYTNSASRGGFVRESQDVNDTRAGRSRVTGPQWVRTLKRTTGTGGSLAYSGYQRFDFDT